MLKTLDLRNMTDAELENKIHGLMEELFKLRFEKRSGRVEKPHKLKIARKDLARAITILKEKKGERSK